MANIIIRHNLHPKQKLIYGQETSAEVVIARCGRKFGKSRGTRAVAARGIQRGSLMAYVAPEYSYLTDWVREFTNIYHPTIKRYSKQEKEVEFHGDGRLDLWSLDNYDSIRPREYDVVMIDEASLSPYFQEAWENAIQPTLARRKGRAYIMSTPKTNKGGPYFRRLIEEHAEDPRYAIFHYDSFANPHVPREFWESYRKQVPTTVYRQEVLAEFVDSEGALIRRDWIKTANPPEGLSYYLGVDLAISQKDSADYTALVVVGIDKDKQVYVVHAERGRWSFLESKRAIIRVADRFNVKSISVEQVQYQAAMIQELRRETSHVVRAAKPKGDKLQRAQPLAGKYEHGYVFHAPTLPADFLKELTEFTGTNDDDHDDYVDALGYAVGAESKPLVYAL